MRLRKEKGAGGVDETASDDIVVPQGVPAVRRRRSEKREMSIESSEPGKNKARHEREEL